MKASNGVNSSAAFLALVAFSSGTLGCSFVMRDETRYERDTREALQARQGQIRTCYEQTLAAEGKVEGETVITFTVQKQTGVFADATVNPASTAPEALSSCILAALDGVELDPVDQRDGVATFTWRFEANGAEPTGDQAQT